MSYVDTRTGKIIGAKKGSIKWLHEQGHIEYSKLEKGIKNSYRLWFYSFITITSLVLGQFSRTFRYASFVFVSVTWFYFLYEEFWCWNYAFKNSKLKGGIIDNGLAKSNARK